MKKVIVSIISLFLVLLSSGTALADTSCQPVYGGGQNCITVGKVLVNKTVQNPQTGQFVDNLGPNDPKFSPNQNVIFNVSITNTGSTTIPQVTVKDVFPGFVTFVSGPGNFDNSTRILTFSESNVNPNETRTETLQVKVVDVSQLPASDMVTCVVNQASITASDTSMSQDNSGFCIQKQQATTKGGLPVFPAPKATTTPSTGPELFSLIGLLPAGLSGWFLRRKSGGKK